MGESSLCLVHPLYFCSILLLSLSLYQLLFLNHSCQSQQLFLSLCASCPLVFQFALQLPQLRLQLS